MVFSYTIDYDDTTQKGERLLDAVTTLLSSLSVEGIIFVIILFAVSVKFLGELFEYIYTKIKNYFNIKDAKEERHEEVMRCLDELKRDNNESREHDRLRDERVEKISQQLDAQDKESGEVKQIVENLAAEVTDLKNKVSILTERTQDSTRAYIIDRHHHFCYKVRAIDDMSLQDLERRFMFYKAAGGDTFIDALMEEIRALPKLTIEQMSSVQERKER